MKRRKKTEEELRRENEERRGRISQEFGGIFERNDQLSPELENQFLKNIEHFEEQFAKAKWIKVYDRLQRPKWIPQENMDDSELNEELNLILEQMREYGIFLNTICDVEDRELYRFITEELFEEVIDDIEIPGMTTNFIYEDFYPNHRYNVEQAVADFINHIMPEECNIDDWFFNEQLKISLRDGDPESEPYRKIRNFTGAYSSFYIRDFIVQTPDISEDLRTASVNFDIAYDAIINDIDETVSFQGPGSIKLTNVYDRLGVHGWDVVSLKMPGFTSGI